MASLQPTDPSLSPPGGTGISSPPVRADTQPPPTDTEKQAKDEGSFSIGGMASIWLGTTMEYVDFALFGLAAGIVFGPVFFPATTPAMALLSGFGTYAVGFLARPAGAAFFGWLGDRVGRKTPLLVTIAMMGLATSGIGLLPSYATAGYLGPILLVVLRLVQGFAAGAEMSGGVIMLAEQAPVARRGLISSVIAIGSNGGVVIGSGIWLLITALPKEDLLSWGWRIPFLCSVFIAIGTLIIRRYMPESPIVVAHRAAEEIAAPVAAPQRRFGLVANKAFVALLGLRISENGPSYLASTFVVGYIAAFLTVPDSVPSAAVFVGSLLGLLAAPVVGHLTDKVGRRIVYRCLAGFLTLYAFPAYLLLQLNQTTVTFTVVVVGFLVASVGMFAAQAAYGVELFGLRRRYQRMALGKEIGSVVSGGVAPMIASALLAVTGHWWAIAAYFAAMSLLGFLTTFWTPETRGRDLSVLEDAM